jgi:hypothetical protein
MAILFFKFIKINGGEECLADLIERKIDLIPVLASKERACVF